MLGGHNFRLYYFLAKPETIYVSKADLSQKGVREGCCWVYGLQDVVEGGEEDQQLAGPVPGHQAGPQLSHHTSPQPAFSCLVLPPARAQTPTSLGTSEH